MSRFGTFKGFDLLFNTLDTFLSDQLCTAKC